MTLHQLKIFTTVAKYLNVTKASAELHITQPAVSRQLSLLREECGVALYRVTPRGIVLTHEGKDLAGSAGAVLSQVERIKNTFSANRKSGVLRIGGSPSPSVSFLPLACAAYQRTHPGLEIDLRTGAGPAIEQLVLRSELEIAVITGPPHDPSLDYEHCRKEKLVAFSSPTCPMRKQTLSASELADVPLVIRRRREGEELWPDGVLRQMEERGLTPKVVMKCDSSVAVKAAVKAGIGVGILFRDMVEPDVRRGELKIIKISDLKMEAYSYIIYADSRLLSVHARDFLALLRQRSPKVRCPVRELKWAQV